jgi:PelA/Pel-15E family pectate lyase
MSRWICALWLISLSPLTAAAADEPPELRKQALQTLEKATQFFRQEVAVSGGYVWRYSDDLKRREGENKVGSTTAWVQPPGTPSIGEAYLAAWRATGDRQYLEAARETALALVQGQLESGGWHYRIEFTPAERARYAYHVDSDQPTDRRQLRNTTTLDDNTSQSAIRLLMRVDQALDEKDAAVHGAVEYALQSLLKVQYPNGAWPQRFDGPPQADQFPVKRASYPETWSRTFPAEKYSSYYTFNDNSLADCIDVMFEASARYGEPKYRTAAERAGGFILLAQMPDPQPAWAQQYDVEMHPAWARKFEPPSITGGESQGIVRILMQLYRQTGDKKYLEPIPRAIDYLAASRLPEGRLARFYELKTNKPLYFTKQYELTYSDADMPTHYGFKVPDTTRRLRQEYDRVSRQSASEMKPGEPTSVKPITRRGEGASRQLTEEVRQVIDDLDQRGRWTEPGKLKTFGDEDPKGRVIECRTFVQNIQTLCSYLIATRP